MTGDVNWKRLFDAAKAACPVGLWSKGVELARAGAVAGQTREPDMWTFRVPSHGNLIAPTATLYPDDEEWDCDCRGRFEVCEHVAACLIALTRSKDASDKLFHTDERNGHVRYQLSHGPRGLILERFLVDAGAPPRRLEQPIVDLIARGNPELTFAPTHGDLTLDRMIGRLLEAPLSFDKATALLPALVGVTDLMLDGKSVRASREPLFPRARVIDAADGAVEVVVEPDPAVTEIVAPGVLRSGDTLHPFGAHARFGDTWERLPFRKVFGSGQMADLVGTVIPELERHISVEIKTKRLPKHQLTLEPWIKFEIDFPDRRSGEHGIDVLPLLVYGDPPVARVDDGRLKHLKGDVPRRDEKKERALLLRLRDELNLAPGRRVHFPAVDAARFLSDLDAFDSGRARTEGTPGRALRGANRHVELAPRLSVRGEEFTLIFEAPGGRARRGRDRSRRAGRATASADAVVAAWHDGIGLVPLSDGGFARIPAGWLDLYGHLVADLLAARDENEGKVPKAALPILGELCEALDSPEPFELARLRPLLEAVTAAEPVRGGVATPSEATLPAGPAAPATTDAATAAAVAKICPDLNGELRHYQATGVVWLARLRDAGLGAILADDMGLGKTIQALCVLRGHTLVVCPLSVIHNWTREIERFRPGLSVGLYHGPGRALGDADVTLTTYATLRSDIDTLAEADWDIIVLDEAQAIKNPDSQVARAAYRLRAGFRLSLSGTPIENRPDELWSQMHFTNRGLLGGRRDFGERYEKPMIEGDVAVTERLRRRIRPFLLRRLKREVATELPPRTEAVLYCELDGEERAIYNAIRMASRADIVRQLADGSSVLAALEALLRLRQAACHSGLLPGRQAPTSSKIEALCDALDDVVADSHKALVFSQWTGLLDRVEPHLTERGIGFTRLDGSTRDRGAVVDAFQSTEGPPVLLISLTAGGTGLNLTAADHVFLLDPWWNPAVEDQAADRAHRIGQDRPVIVYRLVAKDTVEERVIDLQRRKRQIAEAALSGTAAAAASVTREDIMALLE
ncbi:MAG: DEAD/DEAH box helicase [Deltaproteobacteria bacterium]|nr:DEAD/DEAH box helicase [Deltaproteobacteria bacterium]